MAVLRGERVSGRGLAPWRSRGRGGERLWGKFTQILMMLLLVVVPTGKSWSTPRISLGVWSLWETRDSRRPRAFW
jgi:hypothetical protein